MPSYTDKKKKVQFHYNGPPTWMLDPNRIDPIALATKAIRPGTLKDLVDLMTGTTQAERTQKNEILKTISPPEEKESSTLWKNHFPEPDYSGLSEGEKIRAMGKHLEAGYSMLTRRAVKRDAKWDRFLEEESRKIKEKMMNRPWDLHGIKREALLDQRGKVERVKKKSMVLMLPFNGWANLRDSRKRKMRDEDVEAGGGVEKRARI